MLTVMTVTMCDMEFRRNHSSQVLLAFTGIQLSGSTVTKNCVQRAAISSSQRLCKVKLKQSAEKLLGNLSLQVSPGAAGQKGNGMNIGY